MKINERFIRTVAQFIAGGMLTGVIDQLLIDIPDRYDQYILVGSGLLVTWAQTYCEDRGIIPMWLRKPPASAELAE